VNHSLPPLNHSLPVLIFDMVLDPSFAIFRWIYAGPGMTSRERAVTITE
jgi:hypothetical protein